MIAVDWGTSSFRAWRLDAAGAVLEQRSAAAGLTACNGAFESVLAKQLDGWSDAIVVMAGMVGSRSGWREVPYVAAPAGLDEIAAGMVEIDAASIPHKRIFIVPGIAQKDDADTPPEVMRGEETQLMGLFEEGFLRQAQDSRKDKLSPNGLGVSPNGLGMSPNGSGWVCLPGTHSKWVALRNGRIERLRTAMTGELYALLRSRSLLATLMPAEPADDVDDEAAFARGVDASAHGGGVANHLFGVRTLGLFDRLARDAAPSYLSGLLIGHELRALLPPEPGVVHLVGGAALARRYERALARLGVQSRSHGEALAARGLHHLAHARGLPI